MVAYPHVALELGAVCARLEINSELNGRYRKKLVLFLLVVSPLLERESWVHPAQGLLSERFSDRSAHHITASAHHLIAHLKKRSLFPFSVVIFLAFFSSSQKKRNFPKNSAGGGSANPTQEVEDLRNRGGAFLIK